MVKQAETILEVKPQQMITVTVRATVPTQQYGNLTLEATNEVVWDETTTMDVQSEYALNSLKRAIAHVVLPLAEAEVMRCKSVLVKEDHPDAWLQRNSPLYRWLRVAEPDLEIPAMQEILDSKDISIKSE